MDEKQDVDAYKDEIKKEFKNSLGLLIKNITSNDKKSIKE